MSVGQRLVGLFSPHLHREEHGLLFNVWCSVASMKKLVKGDKPYSREYTTAIDVSVRLE